VGIDPQHRKIITITFGQPGEWRHAYRALLETFGVTYVLRKTEGEWKIAVMVRTPPANIIRAD